MLRNELVIAVRAFGPDYGHGGVIKRIGTGEVPVTGLGLTGSLLPLLHPATFRMVTSTFPYWSTELMKTCRNPTMVTLVVPLGFIEITVLSS